uniref:Peptidase S1 domain-containing protein n=1 Tax=Anopheles quadriannulatus TaxID=34691 RepID=A0A182XBJ3_ANOQN
TWLTVNRDGCGLEAPVYTNLRHSASAFVAPWVAKIEYVGEERAGRDNECQAYLITEWHLLTLASCVADVDQNEQELYVRLGKFSIPGLPKPQIRYVEQIIIHERFNKSNDANDVALLKLRKKANVDEGFRLRLVNMKVSCGLGALVALAVLAGSTIASVNGLRRGCGVRKVNYNNLILGGQKAPAGKWPWHAIIVHRAGDTVQAVCGGSIIDKCTLVERSYPS